MATKKTDKELDTATEAKIKAAARIVFHKNGFAATRTRDIAEKAGINLALLNYYFRSKQKLFDIIMMETMHGFFQSMVSVFNDEQSTLDQKLELIAERYINMLLQHPHIPIFLLNELRNNPSGFIEKVNLNLLIMNSIFFKQLLAYLQAKKSNMHPLQVMINMMSLVVFPFVASPVLRTISGLDQEHFNRMMMERKALIPIWIKTML